MKILQDIGKLSNDNDLKRIAKDFEIPFAAVKAVVLVESQSSGFYKDTLIPVVRFENHIFSKKTKGIYDKTHPNLSSSKFTNAYNKKGILEFYRFLEAYELDDNAAIESTSWGIGQLMGFHYKLLGFTIQHEFVKKMFENEIAQLLYMFIFIKETNLLQHLKTQNWAAFAKGYNGVNYAQNKYDEKLAKYFKQYS